MHTRRPAVEWTVGLALVALAFFVPVFQDIWRAMVLPGLLVLAAVALVRGKPEGVRFAILSVVAVFATFFLLIGVAVLTLS
jgi:hypothetical protein